MHTHRNRREGLLERGSSVTALAQMDVETVFGAEPSSWVLHNISQRLDPAMATSIVFQACATVYFSFRARHHSLHSIFSRWRSVPANCTLKAAEGAIRCWTRSSKLSLANPW